MALEDEIQDSPTSFASEFRNRQLQFRETLPRSEIERAASVADPNNPDVLTGNLGGSAVNKANFLLAGYTLSPDDFANVINQIKDDNVSSRIHLLHNMQEKSMDSVLTSGGEIPLSLSLGSQIDSFLQSGYAEGEVVKPPSIVDRENSLSALANSRVLGLARQKAIEIDVETLYKILPEINDLAIDLEQRYGKALLDNTLDLVELGGDRLAEISAQVNPQDTQIREALGQQILTDLQAGGGLGPELDRQITQDIRGAQTARGTAFGNSAVSSEAITKGRFREELKRNRQMSAENLLRTNAATRIDPIAAIMGGNVVRNPTLNTGPTSTDQAAGRTFGLNQEASVVPFNQNQLQILRDHQRRMSKGSSGGGAGAGIGAILGGVGGFMVGGPPGAIAGASLGSSIGGSF